MRTKNAPLQRVLEENQLPSTPAVTRTRAFGFGGRRSIL